MTRLDRVLDLLESYDRLSATALENYHNGLYKQMLFTELLTDLREKKTQLTQELIEHGCRRRINNEEIYTRTINRIRLQN